MIGLHCLGDPGFSSRSVNVWSPFVTQIDGENFLLLKNPFQISGVLSVQYLLQTLVFRWLEVIIANRVRG